MHAAHRRAGPYLRGHVTPEEALTLRPGICHRVGRHARDHRQLGGRSPARLHDRLLYPHLYDLAPEAHAAEHRHRRCGRRFPAHDRLGRRRQAQSASRAIVLFLIIFMWTPPHFWALALLRARDYERARVPMLPVVAGADETRKQIVIYSALLVPLGLWPSFIGLGGGLYVSSFDPAGRVFPRIRARGLPSPRGPQCGLRGEAALRLLQSSTSSGCSPRY